MVFTFDISDHTFTQEDAAGESPSSPSEFIYESIRDKVILSVAKRNVHYNWVYEAHPFNRWKRVTPIGPCEYLESYGAAVLGGRLNVLLGDQRFEDQGLNAYMEIEDLVEEVQE